MRITDRLWISLLASTLHLIIPNSSKASELDVLEESRIRSLGEYRGASKLIVATRMYSGLGKRWSKQSIALKDVKPMSDRPLVSFDTLSCLLQFANETNREMGIWQFGSIKCQEFISASDLRKPFILKPGTRTIQIAWSCKENRSFDTATSVFIGHDGVSPGKIDARIWCE